MSTKLIAKWAIDLGLATGHGDTEQDLLDEIGAQVKEMQDKLIKLRQWTEAYPLDVFPEPDFKKAAKALKENGMTLDAISASNMRHVLKGVQDIIEGNI